MTHPSTKKKKVTKYNEDTGKPYQKTASTTVLSLFNRTFEVESDTQIASQYDLLDFLESSNFPYKVEIISSPETFFNKGRLIPEEYENWLVGFVMHEIPMDPQHGKKDFLFKSPLAINKELLDKAIAVRERLYVETQLAFSESNVANLAKPELFIRYDIS